MLSCSSRSVALSTAGRSRTKPFLHSVTSSILSNALISKSQSMALESTGTCCNCLGSSRRWSLSRPTRRISCANRPDSSCCQWQERNGNAKSRTSGNSNVVRSRCKETCNCFSRRFTCCNGLRNCLGAKQPNTHFPGPSTTCDHRLRVQFQLFCDWIK